MIEYYNSTKIQTYQIEDTIQRFNLPKIIQGVVNVAIKYHPTIGYMMSNKYLKVMRISFLQKETSIPSPVVAVILSQLHSW